MRLLDLRGRPRDIVGVSLGSTTLHTVGYSLCAAVVATLMALPVALLVVRHPSRAHMVLERTTFLVLAVPGLVIASRFRYFSDPRRHGFGYQTAPLLSSWLPDHVLPLALVCVRASVAQAPVSLEEVAGPWECAASEPF